MKELAVNVIIVPIRLSMVLTRYGASGIHLTIDICGQII